MSSINEFEFDYGLDGCLFTTTVGAKAMSVRFLQGKFSLSQNCMIIVKRNNEVFNKYIYYQFQSLFAYYRNLIPDHMQASFRMDDLYQYRFLLPPIKEQKKIATFLDDKTIIIDKAIAIKEQEVNLLKERKQVLIYRAVTLGLKDGVKFKKTNLEWVEKIPSHWEVKRLKYVFQILKRIVGELGHKVLSITQKGIKVKDVESGEGQLSMDYSKYQIVEKGDFAMNHMDLLTGYVDISKYEGVISPDYRVFNLIDNTCDKDYILLLLQIGYKHKIFYAHGQGVSMLGRWRFPADNFNNFRFPIPPLSEQKEISAYIENASKKIETAINLKQKEIEKLKEYKSSLINSVVTGKVKVC
jgi:type I restriction enzyme S subunit